MLIYCNHVLLCLIILICNNVIYIQLKYEKHYVTNAKRVVIIDTFEPDCSTWLKQMVIYLSGIFVSCLKCNPVYIFN